MAIIGKIRQRSWILVGFIAIALLIFIVEAALERNSLFSGGGGKNDVGRINGTTISAKEYSSKISNYEDGLKMINPNLQMNDQIQSQVQEEVWNTIAAEQLLGKAYTSLGLAVSEGEMGDLMWGQQPHPLAQRFLMKVREVSPDIINQETGQLNQGKIREFITNIDKIDKENKTLTIADRGIGMTAEEVDKYLNQVAFSGAEEFLAKYKGQNEANIIGHFGLGFYSSFMVSDKVEVITKSFREGAKAVRWECDGSPEFTLEEVEKEVETFLEKSFHALLYQPVIQRLREAQERTDRVVILSSSPHFLVGPIARKLGVVDWEATRYGCDAEGRMDRVDSVLGGDSKAALLKRWLDQSFVSTEQVTVYSDSLEDLSLLEAAGKAIVVRPRGRLKKIAEQCAWEILNE